MTLKNTLKTSAVAGLSIALLAASAAPAFALSVTASASVSASTSASGANAAARLQKAITAANGDIAARITALNNLNARVQAMAKESAAEKASIASNVQTNISGLQSLQAKINADTTVADATADAKTIFTTFRIYALVMPQGYILAAADRVTVITALMQSLGAKIQARIAADQSAGKDVSSIAAAFADMNAKIADANAQAAAAQSAVANLQPDQGNATVAASNKTVLVAARADIKAATADLKAARQDIATILKGLKTIGGSASASTTVSTQ